jgi:pilus assembly protein CpaE
MTDKTISINLVIKNESLKRTFEDIIASIKGLEVLASASPPPVDLLIIELGGQIDREFELIRTLLDSGGAGEVFIASANTNPGVLLRAIKTGVKEYFSLPLKEEEVSQALQELRDKKTKSAASPPAKSGKILDVIGSKGGVGSTTIAVNLAAELATSHPQWSVALVDMNMLFGDIPLFLEIQPKYHWGEITKNIDRLDATFLMNILVQHQSGVHVLPSPGYLNGYPSPTPETIEHLLGHMQKLFDVVIIDGGQSLNKTSLRTLEISDTVLLVSLLSLPCMSNSNKILKSFDNLKLIPKENIRLVVNRYLKNSEISLKDAQESIQQDVFWIIPNDYRTTMAAINQGKTINEIASKSDIMKSLQGLSDALFPQQGLPEKKRWKLFKR